MGGTEIAGKDLPRDVGEHQTGVVDERLLGRQGNGLKLVGADAAGDPQVGEQVELRQRPFVAVGSPEEVIDLRLPRPGAEIVDDQIVVNSSVATTVASSRYMLQGGL